MASPPGPRRRPGDQNTSFIPIGTCRESIRVLRIAGDVERLFARLARRGQDPALRVVVHQRHVQRHPQIAQVARSELLRQMIERNHVLILNWLFDIAGRREPRRRRRP